FYPGASDVRFVLLNRIGTVIVDRTFPSGSRERITKVYYEATAHSFLHVAIECQSWPPITFVDDRRDGGCTAMPLQRLYIAVQANRMTLVRSVSACIGSFEEVRGSRRCHQLGPNERFVDHSAWSKALMSRDDIDVLEALLYLPPAEAIDQRGPADIERLE